MNNLKYYKRNKYAATKNRESLLLKNQYFKYFILIETFNDNHICKNILKYI